MGKLRRQLQPKKKLGMKAKSLVNKSKKEVQHMKKKKHVKPTREKASSNNEEEDKFDVAPVCLATTMKKCQEQFNEKDGSDEVDTRKMVKNQNKKQKQKQSGGFQSMGLSFPVYKGVMKKGYKVPTPIQRKTISLIMDGKDVVGMARTGSGKTGAFLIPMLEKLNVHSSQAVRAVILSPTRELALQTAKFTTELGKYTDLKSALIVGGDSIENQFGSLHRNPDILIATPGRLLHLLVEMNIKQLDAVEYVVFDEADRLFEMGFAEQLKEIIHRLPQSRQTVLFSATLPKILVDFATAGLNDPSLVRLDVDTKISDKLKTSFILMRDEDKAASLLYMLQKVIKPEEQTVVFASTKHHVEYLHQLLTNAGLTSTYIYSSLDQAARKINLANFRSKTSKVLVVTDIAARGIDIPLLDNVINFDFPSRPKIFVHRVGRVARAGRFGNAYSFLVKDELPFLIDLHLFLGRPLKYCSSLSKPDEDGMVGSIPQGVISNELDFIKAASQTNFDLVATHKVMKNGYKHYMRSRETASVESNKRAKEIDITSIFIHPLFRNASSETNEELSKLLLNLSKFKPTLTVFESTITKKSKVAENVMQSKRQQHGNIIEREQLRQKEKVITTPLNPISSISDDKYIADSFNIQSKGYKDENYIPRQSSDNHQEKGLSLSSFEKEATSLSVELSADDANALRLSKANKKWDRKRKRFVGVENPHAKKYKTESGNYISSSYKSNRYSDWVKKGNLNENNDDEQDGNFDNRRQARGRFSQSRGRGSKRGGRVLKSKEEIVKTRLKDEMMNSIRNKSKKGRKNSNAPGRGSSRNPKTPGRRGGRGRGGGRRR